MSPPPALNDDCWRLVLRHLATDYRTLGRLITVEKRLFYLVAPVLYRDLFDPDTPPHHRGWSVLKQQRLGFLLLRSGGVIDKSGIVSNAVVKRFQDKEFSGVVAKKEAKIDNDDDNDSSGGGNTEQWRVEMDFENSQKWSFQHNSPTINYLTLVQKIRFRLWDVFSWQTPLPVSSWTSVGGKKLLAIDLSFGSKLTKVSISVTNVRQYLNNATVEELRNLSHVTVSEMDEYSTGYKQSLESTLEFIKKHKEFHPKVLTQVSVLPLSSSDSMWKVQEVLEPKVLSITQRMYLQPAKDDIRKDFLKELDTFGCYSAQSLETLSPFLQGYAKKLETMVICWNPVTEEEPGVGELDYLTWVTRQAREKEAENKTSKQKTNISSGDDESSFSVPPLKSMTLLVMSAELADVAFAFRSTLEYLKIRGEHYAPSTMGALSYTLPMLTTLHLIEIEVDYGILEFCPSLEVLKLSTCTNIGSTKLVIPKTGLLKVLHIRGTCYLDVDHESLGMAIMASANVLDEVCLQCSGSTEAGPEMQTPQPTREIKNTWRSAPVLKKLHTLILMGITWIDWHAPLLAASPNLQYIDFEAKFDAKDQQSQDQCLERLKAMAENTKVQALRILFSIDVNANRAARIESEFLQFIADSDTRFRNLRVLNTLSTVDKEGNDDGSLVNSAVKKLMLRPGMSLVVVNWVDPMTTWLEMLKKEEAPMVGFPHFFKDLSTTFPGYCLLQPLFNRVPKEVWRLKKAKK